MTPRAGRGVPQLDAGATIASGLRGRHNGLGLIRILLASAVIVSHAFPLGGRNEDPFERWSLGQQDIGNVAVLGFFAISGYLITKSGMRSNILQYMWARVLRIFPAFWVVLLVSVFVVGPVVWWHLGRDFGNYFTVAPGGAFAYLTNNWNLTIHQWGIADIFRFTPYGNIVQYSVFNGSLWTLKEEFRCYLIIGFLVLFGSARGFKVFVPVLTALLFGMQIIRLTGGDFRDGFSFAWFSDPNLVNLAFVFMTGACIAVYAHRIPLDDRFGMLCAAIVIFTYFRGGFLTVGIPAGAYFLLWGAARMPERMKRVGARNDYSYGVYLYGFLVQQVLAYLGVWKWGLAPFIGISLAASIGLAFASWHVIEKPALRLKHWGPGRAVVALRSIVRAPRPRYTSSELQQDLI